MSEPINERGAIAAYIRAKAESVRAMAAQGKVDRDAADQCLRILAMTAEEIETGYFADPAV